LSLLESIFDARREAPRRETKPFFGVCDFLNAGSRIQKPEDFPEGEFFGGDVLQIFMCVCPTHPCARTFFAEAKLP